MEQALSDFFSNKENARLVDEILFAYLDYREALFTKFADLVQEAIAKELEAGSYKTVPLDVPVKNHITAGLAPANEFEEARGNALFVFAIRKKDIRDPQVWPFFGLRVEATSSEMTKIHNLVNQELGWRESVDGQWAAWTWVEADWPQEQEAGWWSCLAGESSEAIARNIAASVVRMATQVFGLLAARKLAGMG